MMKQLTASVGGLLLLLLVSFGSVLLANAEKIFFTQCDCPSLIFSIEDKPNPDVNVLAPFTATGATAFTCATNHPNSGFPSSLGVTMVGDTGEKFTSTASAALVSSNNDLDGFFIVTQFTMKNRENAAFKVFSVSNAESDLALEVSFVNGGRGLFITLILGGQSAGLFVQTSDIGSIDFFDEAELTIVAGHFLGGVELGVCLIVDSFPSCLTLADAAVDGVTASTINIDLFSDVPGLVEMDISFFQIEADDTLNAVTNEAELEAFALSKVPDPIPALPDSVASPSFVFEEDTTGELDLLTLVGTPDDTLSFTLALSGAVPDDGALGTGFSGAFSFFAGADVFDDFAFNFTYGYDTPYTCFPSTIAGTVSVTNVNDAPVVEPPINVDVFASVDIVATLTVGTDVDFPGDNNLLSSGKFIVKTLSSGLIFDSGCAVPVPAGGLDVENGQVTFCYTPDASMISGQQSTLTFSLTDEEAEPSAVDGEIIFTGQNPVSLADVDPSIEGTEDVTEVFNFLQFGDNDAEENKNFQVQITSLVDPAFGTLQDENDNPVLLGTNDNFDATTEIKFVPVQGFFNVNLAGEGTDVVGDLIGDCENRVAGVCPVSFTYIVTNGDVDSEEGSASFFIRSADNGNAAVVADEQSQTVSIGDAVDDIIITTLAGVEVTSDDGNNIFSISLQLETFDGVQFTYTRDGDLANLVSEENGEGCDSQRCTSVVLIGVPTLLAQVVNISSIILLAEPSEGSDPRIVLTATASNQATPSVFTIRFTVNNVVPFFNSITNIIIVSGTGGGLLLILSIFAIMRATQARRIGEENLLMVAEEAVKIEHKKNEVQRSKMVGSSKNAASSKEDVDDPVLTGKRSLKVNVEDEIFDWEKHIDKDSGEVYFFNPKTGESQWDPPTIKKYDV